LIETPYSKNKAHWDLLLIFDSQRSVRSVATKQKQIILVMKLVGEAPGILARHGNH
jgi:hypothetical protein